MGATAKAYIPGLTDDTIEIEFYQDFAAANVHATINPYVGSSSGATLVIQSNASTVSTTNPKWTLIGSPYNYNPLQGDVGTPSTTRITFRPAAGQAITTGTS